MNYSSATGLSIHQTVSLIVAAKPMDVIVGQPSTETMGKMMGQMAQMVASVKTITREGHLHHGLHASVIDNVDYLSITKAMVTSTVQVTQPNAINNGITG